MKIHGSWGKHLGPALLVAVLALFFYASLASRANAAGSAATATTAEAQADPHAYASAGPKG